MGDSYLLFSIINTVLCIILCNFLALLCTIPAILLAMKVRVQEMEYSESSIQWNIVNCMHLELQIQLLPITVQLNSLVKIKLGELIKI